MIKSLRSAAIAVLALLVATPVAYGNDPSVFMGTWHGVIREYPFFDSDKRTLVVTETNGKLVCTWGISAETQNQAHCSSVRGLLNLTVYEPFAHVILRPRGGRLEGTLTVLGRFKESIPSQVLPISMGR